MEEIKTTIDSFPNIKENKNFNCIEYFRIKEKIKFGINIYKNIDENIEISTIFFFSNENIHFHNIKFRKDDDLIFYPFCI